MRACNSLGILVDLSHLNEAGFWDVARALDAPLVATHSNAHALCAVDAQPHRPQLDAIRDSGGLVGVNFAVTFLREDGCNDPTTPIAEIVRHVDYLVERMGIDHVAFGSDFDGAIVRPSSAASRACRSWSTRSRRAATTTTRSRSSRTELAARARRDLAA